MVDNCGDIVNETDGNGLDTVQSSITFSLFDAVHDNSGKNVPVGGTGIDTVSYEHATAGVTVNLVITTAQTTGGAGRDMPSGFENVTGSAFNNTLTGTSGANTIIMWGR